MAAMAASICWRSIETFLLIVRHYRYQHETRTPSVTMCDARLDPKRPEPYRNILGCAHPTPLDDIRLQHVIFNRPRERARNGYHVVLRSRASNREISHSVGIEPHLTVEGAFGADA